MNISGHDTFESKMPYALCCDLKNFKGSVSHSIKIGKVAYFLYDSF